MEELDENDCRKVDKSLATDEEINQFERDLMTNQALKETEAKLAKAVEALEFLIGDIEWQPKSPSLKYLKQTLKEIKDG